MANITFIEFIMNITNYQIFNNENNYLFILMSSLKIGFLNLFFLWVRLCKTEMNAVILLTLIY
jgi:hypothetical protein